MTNWLTPTKENDYASLKAGYNKETKANDPWNVAITYDTFTWLETDGHIVIVGIASGVTGHAVAKANEANIKLPMPVKIAVKAEGGSTGEQCIVKLIKAGTESGKFYTGVVSVNDGSPFAHAVATGKKADGTELSPTEIAGFGNQFLLAVPCLQDKLTDELIAKMGKVETWGKGGGGYSKAESKAEQIATREAKLKEYLGMKPEDSITNAFAMFETVCSTNPNASSLINTLLA